MGKIKFSEIKDKIRNNRGFNSIKEIKEAGLRVVKTKNGDYWLIEEEYLKPVIRSISRIKKPFLSKKDENEYLIMYPHKQKNKNHFISSYLKYGETKKFNMRETTRKRKPWWNLGNEWKPGILFWSYFFTKRYLVAVGNDRIYGNKEFFLIYPKREDFIPSLFVSLNSTYIIFWIELYGITNTPSLVKTRVYDIPSIPILILNNIDQKVIQSFGNREIHDIFTELGFDPSKPIREQEPNPLPDRKALDDVVFDALGLTEEERKEVYWSVAELVKSRLDKARSFKK